MAVPASASSPLPRPHAVLFLVWAVFGLLLLNASLSSLGRLMVSGVPTPTPPRPPADQSAPAPFVNPVRLTGSQFIIPPEYLPDTLSVAADHAIGAEGWEREFQGPGYYHLLFTVWRWSETTRATDDLARRGCALSFGTPPTSVMKVEAPATGDGSYGCVYHWDSGIVDWTQYVVATRNVTIVVSAEPRRQGSNETELARLVAYARLQLEILDGVAP